MRYLTYNLNYPTSEYGYGPDTTIDASGTATLTASMFVDNNGTHLGYLNGEYDLSTLTEYDVAELTQTQALAWAQAIAPDAYLLRDGTITTPIDEVP